MAALSMENRKNIAASSNPGWSTWRHCNHNKYSKLQAQQHIKNSSRAACI